VVIYCALETYESMRHFCLQGLNEIYVFFSLYEPALNMIIKHQHFDLFFIFILCLSTFGSSFS
jgi:hypothetical protein